MKILIQFIKRKRKPKDQSSKRKMFRTDMLVWFVLINSVAWVWCSYILAWFKRADTVSTVSGYVVTEVIAVVIAIAIKNVIENLSKNNTWPDKPTCCPTDNTDTKEDRSGPDDQKPI